MAVQDLKIFGINLFLNILNLSIPLNFIYPKIRITDLDEHTSCICGLFADRDVMHDLYNWVKPPLIWNVELKTLNYFSCLPVYELRFLTQFPQIAPTAPNTFSNRYNLTLRWSWHFSMVLLDVKYRAEDWITSRVSQPWSRVFQHSFSKVAIMPKVPKNRSNSTLRLL